MHATNIIHYNPGEDTRWQDYFSIRDAYQQVIDHVLTLPSSRNAEQHTLDAYTSGLDYFLTWLAGRLPTRKTVAQFITHLKTEKENGRGGYGLTSSTIGSKYLAPVRHFLNALHDQHIRCDTGSEYLYIGDCKQHISSASRIKTPPKDESSHLAPLDATGNRLTKDQVNRLFMAIDTTNLIGLRDLALLYVGFTSGLRNAELRRMTLDSITMGTTTYEVHVRGKRNNRAPVPVDIVAINLIDKYVSAYNDTLPQDDPRRINDDTPIWQPLLHGSNHCHIGINGYDPMTGISAQGIRNILKKWALAAGIKLQIRLTAHDMRRTIAAIMRDAGADYGDIQRLLRHKNIATTFKYIGEKRDLSKALASQYVDFTLPTTA